MSLVAVRDPATSAVTRFRDTDTDVVYPLAALKDRALIRASLRAGLKSEAGPFVEFFRDITTLVASTVAMPSYIVDSAGYMRDTCTGEAVAWGERRAENFFLYPTNLTVATGDGWNQVAGLTAAACNDSNRAGESDNQSDFVLTRAANINSMIRNLRSIRRPNRPAPYDLLRPVPHWLGCQVTQLPGDVAQAELRVYNPNGLNVGSKLVALTTTRTRYAIQFTPARPRKAEGWSWLGGSLTITATAHGISSGVGVRLSGFVGSNVAVQVDGDYTLTGRTTDTITVAVASDPGTMATAGRVQLQYLFSVSPDSWAASTVSAIQVGDFFCEEAIGSTANAPGDFIPRNSNPDTKWYYDAAVDGVRYFDTENSNTYNATTGVVTPGPKPGALLTTVKGLATFPTTHQIITDTDALSVSFGSGTGLTVTDLDEVGPDGELSMSKLTEDTNNTVHRIQRTLTGFTTYDGVYANFNAVVKWGGATNGQRWLYLQLDQLDGTTRSAWFDCQNQSIGTTAIGTIAIEKGLANNCFRVCWSVPLGTGSTELVARIGFASANGSVASYTGTSKYNWVGFVNFTVGPSATSQRPMAVPFCNARAVASTHGGQVAWIPLLDRIGYTNFAVQVTSVPYYDYGWTSKQVYVFPWEVITDAPPQNAGGFNLVNFDRMGPAVRPSDQASFGGGSLARIAWDFYNGDSNRFYVFRTGRVVKAGDWIVPSAILPNNSGAVKGYEVINDGILGTEPSWTTGNGDILTSNGVTLQCNNYLHSFAGGRWEATQNGSIPASAGFMGDYRIAMRLQDQPPDVSCKVNGADAPKEFPSWPNHKNRGATLRYRPKALMLGAWYPDALPPTANGSRPAAGMCGAQTLFHREVMVWNDAIEDAVLEAFNALQN